MAQVTPYTNTAAIRGCLGIDLQDCSDDTILESNLELELLVDLDGWLPTHAAIHAAGKVNTATAEERHLWNVLQLYAQWFCAFEVVSRFMLLPQIVTDGKNQLNRFPNVDLKDAKAEAAARMAKYRGLLDEEVNGATAVSSLPLVAISTPAYDPVTNT